jgi:hypothetical protein
MAFLPMEAWKVYMIPVGFFWSEFEQLKEKAVV